MERGYNFDMEGFNTPRKLRPESHAGVETHEYKTRVAEKNVAEIFGEKLAQAEVGTAFEEPRHRF